jgi:hypothetical protein
MTDKAWEKWAAIREKWDPHRRIGGFREKSEMNVLHKNFSQKSHGSENAELGRSIQLDNRPVNCSG